MSRSSLDKYPSYEVVIGIEVHAQLTTASKIFCSCANEPSKDPNTNICVVCAGFPGSLPVLNEQVINKAILAALATKSIIASETSFDRKHYFYPDLPKGYQITQHFRPICSQGYVPIRLEDGTIKKVRLHHIHIEEDAGKNIHSSASNESFVDLNRAGTPLLEIVSEPDMASAYEAKAYLKMLRLIVTYLGICSGNMEEGAFRADTNISVRKKGETKLGTKCELKNINSFKFIGDAIEYEIERQIQILEEGGKVRQETRSWNTKLNQSEVLRSKEEAADYRYMPEPDIPSITIDEAKRLEIEKTLPELPFEKFERLVSSGITPADAEILVDNRELAQFYDEATKATSSKQLIFWIVRDLMGYLKEKKIELSQCKITASSLAELVNLIDTGKINNTAAKEVFATMAENGQSPEAIVKEKGLQQIESVEELEKIIVQILQENPKIIEQYKSGKVQMFGFFVGQAMKKTNNKGNPQIIQELLKKHLG